jgi:hypothetical protein
MVREPDATRQPTPHDIQLMSKHRVLSFKPQLRLEWRGQEGHNETEQPDHSASLGDSITASTQIRFSVRTGTSYTKSAGDAKRTVQALDFVLLLQQLPSRAPNFAPLRSELVDFFTPTWRKVLRQLLIGSRALIGGNR